VLQIRDVFPWFFVYTFFRNSGEQILQELLVEVDNESLVITSPDEDEEDSASNRSQFSNVVLRIITYPLLGIITSVSTTTEDV